MKKLEFFGTYGVARDITDRKRAEEVISYQAYHDILTDLPNRMLFKDRLGLAVIQAKRKQTELAVMFIDLDRFKLVNDTLGHVKGDELLQQVAMRLKACLRRGDTLARQGGDEFTIVLPELRDRDDAHVRRRQVPRMPAEAVRPRRPRGAHLGQHRHRGLSGRRRNRSTSCCAMPTSRCTRSRR